jgi:alpha-beta hydrolase superfamily lysophospholipase
MELAYLTTPDNYSCEALFWPKNCDKKTRLGAVLVHGWSYWYDPRVRTRGFCGKYMASVGSALADAGVAAVLPMNRGFHAPEFFNDCSVDFETAIDFLVANGCEEIVIIGHSLGGAKCAYYAGEVGHPRLRGVVLLSAIPSSYNFEGKEKEELITRARQLLADGQQHTIVTCQEGKTVSLYEPAALIKSFEHGYRGTTLEAASKITLPILSLAAEREWNWFQMVTKGIQPVATKAASVDAEIIQGAKDHTYSGYEEQIARRVCAWVASRITS